MKTRKSLNKSKKKKFKENHNIENLKAFCLVSMKIIKHLHKYINKKVQKLF